MKIKSIIAPILAIVFGLSLISCEKAVFNEGANYQITGAVQDISADEGIATYEIMLDEIYGVANQSGMQPDNTVYANSNPDLVEAEIVSRVLVLHIVPGQTGTAEIAIRSRVESTYRDDRFTVSISPITADLAMSRAQDHFSAGSYDLAASHFNLVVVKNEADMLSDGYLGLGYSRMRMGSAVDNYGYQDLLISRALDPANVDAIAGLSFLDYAVRHDYELAIENARTVLEKSPGFVFRFDSRVDKSDILLNIALCQYELKRFSDCQATIEQLDNNFAADPDAADYHTQLYEHLQVLIDLYK